MTISSCPHCGEQYLVSNTEVPNDATVQCPWCSEQFLFIEVVQRLPPELIVLSNTGTAAVEGSLNPFDTPSNPSPESASFDFSGLSEHVGLDPDDTNLGNPSIETYQTSDSGDHTSNGWEDSQSNPETPPEFSRHHTQANRKSSGIGSFIGIILGGLLSLPLAGLILLALGKAPDLGFWPFLGNEPSSRRSAAPLPPSNEQGTLRGTPLRFNQPPEQSTNGKDPAEDALDSILNSNEETSETEASTPDPVTDSTESLEESELEQTRATTQNDPDNGQ